MGKKCWVVGCKTGYLTNKAVEQEQAAKGTPITLHKFPRDDELRARWLKNIKRDEKDDPSAERYCCSLHFKASDFKVTPTVQGGRQRQNKQLVEDAVPTNFSHRCQEGHNLANTILPHISRSLFNCFGANFSKDVTSEARKNKALKQPTGRQRSSIEEGMKETARNRDVYKSRKLTGAHKS